VYVSAAVLLAVGPRRPRYTQQGGQQLLNPPPADEQGCGDVGAPVTGDVQFTVAMPVMHGAILGNFLDRLP